MELRKAFNNIISFLTIITVFFGPFANCLANEIPSINMPMAFKASNYDGICQLLDLIELGGLDRRLNQGQIHEVNSFIGNLAIKGGNSSDLLEMQELREDVCALVHSDSPSFQYAYLDGEIQFIPAVFTGKHDLVLCGLGKGWDKTKKFVKKHKKAIIIGAVVATVIITAAVIITMSGGAATPGAQALVSGGASIVAALEGNCDTNGTVQPLDPALEQKIEEFKEVVYENNLLESTDPTFPEEESAKAAALAFSRDLLEDHLKEVSNAENIYQSVENKFSTNPWLKASSLEDNLANFHHIRGERALELGYYTQAVSDFSDTIKLQPENELSYLDRANAYYHIGEYENSLKDFETYTSKKPLTLQSAANCSYNFTKGLAEGVKDSGCELIQFAENVIIHPIRTASEAYYAFETLASLVTTNEWKVIAKGLSPEAHELIANWEHLEIERKFYLAGYTVGKHGGDILLPIGAAKISREVIVACNSLKNTKGLLALESLAQNQKLAIVEENYLGSRSGFTGKKGWELKNPQFQPTRNSALNINGRTFRAHAIDQMQNRGIPLSVVEHALEHSDLIQVNKSRGTTIYFDKVNNIKVVVNSSNEIITVIPLKGK